MRPLLTQLGWIESYTRLRCADNLAEEPGELLALATKLVAESSLVHLAKALLAPVYLGGGDP